MRVANKVLEFILIVLGTLLFLIFLAMNKSHAGGIGLTWDAPILRTDDTTIAPDTITGYQVFLNGLPVPTAQSIILLTYSYDAPKGTCILPTDKWTLTATDSLGLVSAPSIAVSVAAKICTPKSAPAAPGNVKITTH